MPRQVHADTANYTIEWDPEIEAVVHTWTEFTTGQEYRDGANELLEVIKETNASKLIVDTSGIQAHAEEDKQWLEEEWSPRIVEEGVRYTATVHSDSAISQMEMESFVEDMDEVDQTIMVTGDMSEARDWIAKQ